MHIKSTKKHLFFDCSQTRQRSRELNSLTRDNLMEGIIQDSLFATISCEICCNKRRPAGSILISEMCWTNQTKCNVSSYGHTYNRLPNWTLSQRVETKLKVMKGKTTSMKKVRQIEKGIQDCINILLLGEAICYKVFPIIMPMNSSFPNRVTMRRRDKNGRSKTRNRSTVSKRPNYSPHKRNRVKNRVKGLYRSLMGHRNIPFQYFFAPRF